MERKDPATVYHICRQAFGISPDKRYKRQT
jgi:hypothetical protein